MPQAPSAGRQDRSLIGTPDVPLIVEQLQNQIDDLTAAVRAQQDQLAHQAARIAALERS
ncbi:hypothetical protein [Microlunatus elymi]|uniref:hypothetical protein n=1 Tax=Microlunatus elymi TaxID=2596828 RepID=UPI00143DE41F|nr:hypothetical protein [Microlunatus elymi]